MRLFLNPEGSQSGSRGLNPPKRATPPVPSTYGRIPEGCQSPKGRCASRDILDRTRRRVSREGSQFFDEGHLPVMFLGAVNEVVMEREVGGSHRQARLWHRLRGASQKRALPGVSFRCAPFNPRLPLFEPSGFRNGLLSADRHQDPRSLNRVHTGSGVIPADSIAA